MTENEDLGPRDSPSPCPGARRRHPRMKRPAAPRPRPRRAEPRTPRPARLGSRPRATRAPDWAGLSRAPTNSSAYRLTHLTRSCRGCDLPSPDDGLAGIDCPRGQVAHRHDDGPKVAPRLEPQASAGLNRQRKSCVDKIPKPRRTGAQDHNVAYLWRSFCRFAGPGRIRSLLPVGVLFLCLLREEEEASQPQTRSSSPCSWQSSWFGHGCDR